MIIYSYRIVTIRGCHNGIPVIIRGIIYGRKNFTYTKGDGSIPGDWDDENQRNDARQALQLVVENRQVLVCAQEEPRCLAEQAVQDRQDSSIEDFAKNLLHRQLGSGMIYAYDI